MPFLQLSTIDCIIELCYNYKLEKSSNREGKKLIYNTPENSIINITDLAEPHLILKASFVLALQLFHFADHLPLKLLNPT